MASPEHIFHRPYVVFAPDNKVDSDVSCQQSHLSENALTTPQHLLGNLTADLILTEEHHQTEQNDDSSLGQLAQGAVDFVKQAENPQGEISYEEEQHALFSFKNTKVMRERRAMWQETGFIPPIAGGQERKGRKKDGST